MEQLPMDEIDIKGCDPQIVYGALCTWWDSINKVSFLKGGLPCCPYCKGVLLQVGNEKIWFSSVDEHEAKGNKGYRKYIEWLRGKCFGNYVEALKAYKSL